MLRKCKNILPFVKIKFLCFVREKVRERKETVFIFRFFCSNRVSIVPFFVLSFFMVFQLLLEKEKKELIPLLAIQSSGKEAYKCRANKNLKISVCSFIGKIFLKLLVFAMKFLGRENITLHLTQCSICDQHFGIFLVTEI